MGGEHGFARKSCSERRSHGGQELPHLPRSSWQGRRGQRWFARHRGGHLPPAGPKRRGGEAIGVAADLTDFAVVERMRRRVVEEHGPVDVLAAFAGGQGYPTPTEQMAEEQWRSVMDSDLTATFLTVRSFLPGMIERGGGSIVTMASSAARLPSQASAAYAAAKAGVVMFSKHVASEVGQHGVRVNCLAPSSVLTERVKRLMPEETQRQVASMHPLGRMGTPEDVALATLFLASESSSWITGVTLDVAGGRIMV